MIMTVLDGFARDRMVHPSVAALSPLRRLWTALRRRQWRRARPFVHMNDHLRRDIGLPPLDGRYSGR
jgi:hypothetical protein